MMMLAEQDFYAALEAGRKPKGSGQHPFSIMWANGGLSREQPGQWAIQHYYYISVIPPQFAALYARMPDAPGRHLLTEHLVGEAMPAEPETSDPHLLLKFALAFRLDTDTVETAEGHGTILPGTIGK